jgi:hypothetical protein
MRRRTPNHPSDSKEDSAEGQVLYPLDSNFSLFPFSLWYTILIAVFTHLEPTTSTTGQTDIIPAPGQPSKKLYVLNVYGQSMSSYIENLMISVPHTD